jgi:hypothetical protein
MAAIADSRERAREALVAELTETALRVTARHGVEGSSVDHEIELWNVLGHVAQNRTGQASRRRTDGLVAEMTDAAYRVALDHGIRGSFVDLEMDLWQALCWVLRGRVTAGETDDCACPAPAVA